MLPPVEFNTLAEKIQVNTNGAQVADGNRSLARVPATPPSIELLEFFVAAGFGQIFEPQEAALGTPPEVSATALRYAVSSLKTFPTQRIRRGEPVSVTAWNALQTLGCL